MYLPFPLQIKNRLTNISRHSGDKHLKAQSKEKVPHPMNNAEPSIEAKDFFSFTPNDNTDHRPLNRSRANSVVPNTFNAGDLSPFGGGSSVEFKDDDSLLHEVSRVHRATDTINIGIALDSDAHNSSLILVPSPKSPSRNFTFSATEEDSKLDTLSYTKKHWKEEQPACDSVSPPRLHLTAEEKKMHAKDVLLINQLKSGIIPEQLLKRAPSSMNLMSLNLAHYGLGDELGKCLGGWYVFLYLNVFIV